VNLSLEDYNKGLKLFKKIIILFNAVLLPIAASGIILILLSSGENMGLLWSGILITVLSPIIAYFIVLKLYKPKKKQ